MSKTTKKYGVPIILHSFIEAHPELSENLKKQWVWLNKISNFLHGANYFELNHKTRVIIHEIVNGVPDHSITRMKLVQAKLL